MYDLLTLTMMENQIEFCCPEKQRLELHSKTPLQHFCDRTEVDEDLF